MVRLRRVLLPDAASLCVTALAAAIALSPPKSFDLFFHLASGRDLLAHGFPARDPFSFTASGPQFPHEWPFGIVAELSARAFGAAGPELLVALLFAATALLLWHLLGPRPSRGMLATVLFVLVLEALSPTFAQERPWHFGQLLFVALLLLLRAYRAGSARAGLLVLPLTALWANLHASWPLAPALFGLTALGMASDPAPRRAAAGVGLSAAAFLCAGASIPGPALYLYPLRHALLPSTAGLVEWMPLALDLPFARAYFMLLLLAVFFTGRTRKAPLALVLPAAALAAGAVLVIRLVPFAALALAAAIAEMAEGTRGVGGAWGRVFAGVDRGLRRWNGAAGGGVLPFAAVGIVAMLAAHRPGSLEARLPREDYPVAALHALEGAPPGRVLARLRWGGAVAYFAPGHPVFIDGRNDLFPAAIHEAYVKMKLLEPGWREAFAAARPDYVLWGPVHHGTPLLAALGWMGWREVAGDATGSLWIPPPARAPGARGDAR